VGCAVEIFYRSLFPRSRKPRRARKILIIAALAAMPALAASTSQALGTPSILTASTQDDNANGYLDKVRVVFSTAMDQSLMPKISTGDGSPGIRVEGYQIDTSKGDDRTGFDWAGSQTLDIFLIEGSTPDTGVTPTLHYVPGGDVQSAPPAPAELAATERATTDTAAPVLVAATANAVRTLEGMFKYVGDELFLEFSEPTSLVGNTKVDRWSNLERAIKFLNEGGGCPTDGDGTNAKYNFPQPKAENPTGADAIVAPSSSSEYVSRFLIKYSKATDQHASLNRFPAVPIGCWVGVDEGTQVASGNLLLNRANLRDSAANVAAPMSAINRIRIYPTAVEVDSAKTRDLDHDGEIDAVELTFSQNIDADSIAQTFTVRNGTTSVQTSGIEVGAANNILIARFDGPASWDTITTPTVSYTKPASCGTESGAGLRVTYGTFRLCVESFTELQTTDGAGPVLTAATTADGNGDGRIDSIALTFNEVVADTPGKSMGWSVEGQAVEIQIDPEDGRHATLSLTAPIAETDARPSVAYAAQTNPASQDGSMDIAGNQVGSVSGLLALDGTAPWITSAAQRDINGDGNIDRAVLTYSEPLVDPATAAGFTIGGRPTTLVAPAGDDAANDVTLTLAVSGLTGTDIKEIVFTPGATIRDAAGNASGTQTVIATDVTDEAAPRATISVSPSAPIPAGESTIVVTFTEPMDTDVAPTVTFTTEQGAKTVEPVGFDADGRAWEGTIEVVELDCTVSAGCPVTASASGGADPAGNALGAPASLTTEIDTVAPAAPVIGSFTATLPAGETAPADTLNMFASDFSVSASIVPGEASPGIATVLLDGTPLDGAVDSAIATGDTSISASSSFGSAAALQAALTEEPHSLTIELCDDAGNCTETATGLDVVVDYTPAVDISLTAPTGGNVIAGGSSSDIVWDGADGDGFDHVTLSYSTNGGQTFPNVIADGLTDRDGTHTWSVPPIDSQNVVVRAALADTEGNKSFGLSDPFGVRSNSVFSDVPSGYWARHHIEAIFDAGITGGCGGGKYCPTNSVTRGQMAVFLVKAMGEDADLGPYQGTFSDVPASNGFALYIERLAELGITSGCGGGKYCPGAPVTRGQMAVFLVRALDEDGNLGSYQGLFTDVPSTNSFALYIEKLADLQITGGCGGGKYCPGASVTRAQMAVFMQKAWDLPMLG